MAISVNMLQPSGWTGAFVAQSGASYTPNSLGIMSVAQADIADAQSAGFATLSGGIDRLTIEAPVAADLISIKAAATPANGTITIAAQPPHSRKFQVRVVLGTPGTTNITAGTLTLVGIDQDGNTITETISLVTAASVTLTSKYAYASLTSGTVAGYAANGSGTGNTLGMGVSNDFGVPTVPGGNSAGTLVCVKATKITAVLGTSVTAADDDAATTIVDPVARTIQPTTAPSGTGLINYHFAYAFGTIGATAST